MEIEKIAGILLKGGLLGVKKNGGNGNRVPRAEKGAKKDEVILSGKSQILYQYQAVKKTYNLPSQMRMEKIESLKKQIKDGIYYVPAEKIAVRIWKASRAS